MRHRDVCPSGVFVLKRGDRYEAWSAPTNVRRSTHSQRHALRFYHAIDAWAYLLKYGCNYQLDPSYKVVRLVPRACRCAR